MPGFVPSQVLGTWMALAGQVGLGALAGFVATLAMDLSMWQQPEGFTPAYLTASVLRRTPTDEIAFREASVVHHAAGTGAGMLYALVHAGLTALLPPVLQVGGVPVGPHVGSVVAVVLFVYGLFAHVVFPLADRTICEERATAVRGQWLRSAFVFGVVLVVLVPALWPATGGV